MDIFKQKRYLIFVSIVLVILNISTMLMLWLDRPVHRRVPVPPPFAGQEQKHLRQQLKVELGFDDSQINQYFELRHDHRQKIQRLETEIGQIKRQMFDEVLRENSLPMLSDSLLEQAQEKQAQIEQLTFQHFLDLKKLCKPDQQDKLKMLMHELFQRQHPGGDARPMRPPQHEPPPHSPFQNE